MKTGSSQLFWVILIICLFAFGGGINIIGPVPPIKVDQLSALIVEETGDRTTDFNKVVGAIQALVKEPRFRKLDKDNPPNLDEQWVRDAWEVWKQDGGKTPWLVAASASRGVHQALPADAATATTLIQGLGK